MSIVGISGYKQVGKDTVGSVIQYLTDPIAQQDNLSFKDYQFRSKIEGYSTSPWKIKKFATKIKKILSLLTGISVKDMEKEEIKNSYLSSEWDRLNPHNHIKQRITIRLALQYLGTDLFRNHFHPGTWLNSLFVDYKPDGYKNTKIWRTYHTIKQRCNNPKHPRYNDYGGRGIKMCKQWENSIISFINWAKENGYTESLTIDRKNNNGIYSPENCRCVSYSTQAINTKLRRDNTSGYKGVSKDKHNWRASIQIQKKQYFLGYFDTAEQASEAYEEKFLEREGLYETEEMHNITYPLWLITDCRFPDEANTILDKQGIVIRVNRLKTSKTWYNEINKEKEIFNIIDPDGWSRENYDLSWAGEKIDILTFYNRVIKSTIQANKGFLEWVKSITHESETALDSYNKFNYIIQNDGSIDDLIEKIKKILVKEKLL